MLDNDVKSRTLNEQNVHKEDNWRTSGDEEHQPASSEQLTVDLQLLPASPGGAGGAASGPVLQDFQVQTQAQADVLPVVSEDTCTFAQTHKTNSIILADETRDADGVETTPTTRNL